MISIKKDGISKAFTCHINGKTLTLDPVEALDYDSTYIVTIPREGIKDSANYYMEDEYTLSFTTKTIPDLTAPYLVDTYPANNQRGVLIDTNISLNFSENIIEGDIHLLNLTHGSTVVDCVYSITDNILTIDPISDLQYNTLYTVAAPAGTVQDFVYNPSNAALFSFTTVVRTNGGNGGSSGSSSSNRKQEETTLPSQTTGDQLLKTSLKEMGRAVIPLTEMDASKANITLDTVKMLQEEDKPLYVENTGVKLTFFPDSLSIQQEPETLENEKAYLELGAETLAETDKEQILKKIPSDKNTGIFEIGGKIFNLTAKTIIENKDGTTTKEIEAFLDPVEITLDLSGVELTEEDISKLCGIRYERDNNGDILPVKLGGSYDKDTKTFTFYTDKFSLYGIGKVDNLKTIKLTINQYTVKVNNEIKTNDAAPMLINNRTMVPIRFVAENLGAHVEWVEDTRNVIIDLGGKTLTLTIDKPIQDFDVPPTIVNNRTLVPIRYVSEELGASILWFPSDETVLIVK